MATGTLSFSQRTRRWTIRSARNSAGNSGAAAVRIATARNIAIPEIMPNVYSLPFFSTKACAAISASTRKNIDGRSLSIVFTDWRISAHSVISNTETDISSTVNRHRRIA